MRTASQLAARVEERLLDRNQIMEHFFSREAPSSLADFPLIVHCDYIPRIQEVQASVYHIIREILEVLRRGEA